MNRLVALANYPPVDLPTNTFATATDYVMALARSHMAHLRTQHNDAVENEADCRKKYVARCLFLKIAKSFPNVHDRGPFRLICDDLRPSNVIIDEKLNLRCVIDWEFTYAAPADFTCCSPWWLLLYLPLHAAFLQALKETEDKESRCGALSESQRLSGEMARFLQNGTFWFCLAATSSFAFDDIYWRFIDSGFYGEFTCLEERIGLLTAEEQVSLEEFVRLKVQ
ncbi:hypothetical protein AYO21_06736 [Fonsecaea monophora]|uniref:Aminoglycoside phosphotransferase domain-containing protein n=1 Tax=Fonsecaea monophora TaxID=254056 RepID=A0A177F5A4_9EURO|nr:hypothetical protein AYO21_06736 [Fonsecaea monophora]OAG39016.1 hypothetical protein AYO21_06736 [Fonsecaea monophora]